VPCRLVFWRSCSSSQRSALRLAVNWRLNSVRLSAAATDGGVAVSGATTGDWSCGVVSKDAGSELLHGDSAHKACVSVIREAYALWNFKRQAAMDKQPPAVCTCLPFPRQRTLQLDRPQASLSGTVGTTPRGESCPSLGRHSKPVRQ
jgi:hypothetical protein